MKRVRRFWLSKLVGGGRSQRLVVRIFRLVTLIVYRGSSHLGLEGWEGVSSIFYLLICLGVRIF